MKVHSTTTVRKSLLNRFITRKWCRKGFGTLEVVIIIAVLLSIALLFRTALTNYARNLIQVVLGDQSVIDDLANDH
ncbi:MAG: hypothetical protein VB070_04500 [Clostridiaceae bacterium]|nr:hypothetical protein [Clostridiaceae bacterium]